MSENDKNKDEYRCFNDENKEAYERKFFTVKLRITLKKTEINDEKNKRIKLDNTG